MTDVIFKILGEPEPERPIELEWFIEQPFDKQSINLCVRDSATNKEWIVCKVNKNGMDLWDAMPNNIGFKTDKDGCIEIIGR